MSNEEIYEYYGWKSHKFGFFYEWRDEVNRRVELTPQNQYEIIRVRANFSEEVFNEIFSKLNPIL